MEGLPQELRARLPLVDDACLAALHGDRRDAGERLHLGRRSESFAVGSQSHLIRNLRCLAGASGWDVLTPPYINWVLMNLDLHHCFCLFTPPTMRAGAKRKGGGDGDASSRGDLRGPRPGVPATGPAGQ